VELVRLSYGEGIAWGFYFYDFESVVKCSWNFYFIIDEYLSQFLLSIYEIKT